MSFEELKLASLRVNAANDRHGELTDESSAIAWLFNNKEQHMKSLANDIVNQSEVYEPPLVVKRKSKYVIYDGNRRVTCLKLLRKPEQAPTTELQAYFKRLRENWKGEFPTKLMCQIETDIERIDDILYRRHTGTQSGVGQTTWDDRMKRNFIERTGRSKGLSIADKVEILLAENDKLPKNRDIPRSTMNRLLSSEVFFNRVGLSSQKGKLVFTHSESVVLNTLQRIAHDLSSRKITLGDLWDSKRKNMYLDDLASQGLLPTDADKISVEPNSGTGGSGNGKPKPKPKLKPKPKPKPVQRRNLIETVDYGIVWTGKLQRHQEIWEELQFHLELNLHPNAISVLLRVLIELSVKHYINESGLQTVHKDDSLANKITKISADFLDKGLIDKDYKRDLKKMEQAENLLSVNTLNRYIHAFELSPSPKHLKAIWDSISKFVVLCLTT